MWAKPMTRTRARLSRHRIVWGVNATFLHGRYNRARVDTCVPSARLALYGNRWFGNGEIVERERVGRWHWRYEIRRVPDFENAFKIMDDVLREQRHRQP